MAVRAANICSFNYCPNVLEVDLKYLGSERQM